MLEHKAIEVTGQMATREIAAQCKGLKSADLVSRLPKIRSITRGALLEPFDEIICITSTETFGCEGGFHLFR
jgi:hypothetical protein